MTGHGRGRQKETRMTRMGLFEGIGEEQRMRASPLLQFTRVTASPGLPYIRKMTK